MKTSRLSRLAVHFWIGFCVLIACNVSAINAQSKIAVIDSDRPTIYVSFEQFGTYESPCGEEKSPGIWLRLTNNTKWSIYVDGRPVIEDSADMISFQLSDGSRVRGIKNDTKMRLRYDFEGVSVSETKIEQGRILLNSPIEVPLPKQSKLCSQKWMGVENRGFWIASGASVSFSIPRSFLTDKLRVNVQYNYEWEASDGQIRRAEPHHLVYFYGTELPLFDNPPKIHEKN